MAVRITQIVPETVVQPSGGKLRITQVVPETVVQPSTGKIRVSQLVVETVHYITIKRPPQIAMIM